MLNRKIIVDREPITPSDIKPNMDFDRLVDRVAAPQGLSITKKIIRGISIVAVITGTIITCFYFLDSPIQNEITINEKKSINKGITKNDTLKENNHQDNNNQSENNYTQQNTPNCPVNTATKSSTQNPSALAISQNKEQYSSLEYFYKRTALPSQTFIIEATRDAAITGAQGTKLVIKANSFVDLMNQPVKGQIIITLKECYKLEDMLNEGLTTMANHKILESGGMIYIEAKSGEKQLKLKKFEEIAMYNPIPEVMADTTMCIFYGEAKTTGELNWKKDNYSRIPYPIAASTGGKFHDTSSIKYFADHFRFDKEKMIKALNKKDTIRFNVTFNELIKPVGSSGGKKDLLPGSPLCEFIGLVENNYIAQIQKATRETEFQFNIMDKEAYESYYKEYKEYVDDVNLKKGNFKRLYDSSAVFHSRKNAPFYIGTIGWVNCDRFAEGTVDVNQIHFTLNSAKDEDLKLVFYSRNRPSIIKAIKIGNTWHFPNIPVNKEVTVIGTFLKEGEIHTASQKFKVQKEETLHQLEYKLKAMP